MKKSLFYILCLALVAGACMQDQTNPLVVPSCYDGIKNQDEKAIDCGGRCLACKEPVVSPCTRELANNVMTVLNKTWTLKSTDYQSYPDNYGQYTFNMTLSSAQQLVIIIAESNILTEDKIYPIVQYPSVTVGSAEIVLYDDSTWNNINYYADSGSVYVTVRNGKVTAEICRVLMKSYQTTTTSYLSGRITSQ
jgi:hypothetical protein